MILNKRRPEVGQLLGTGQAVKAPFALDRPWNYHIT